MIELFRRISLAHFRRHKLRTALTVLGFAVGIMALVGLRLLFASIHDSYVRTVRRIAGNAVLQISNGNAGIPEELLAEVQRVRGVGAAMASVNNFVPIVGHGGDRLFIFGVDLLADRTVRDYKLGEPSEHDGARIEDAVVFLAKADSVALTAELLKEGGLKVGDTIEVMAPKGRAQLRIRGALDIRTGPATLFGGRLALMDIFAAQKLLALDHRWSRIDVALAPDAQLETVEARLKKLADGRAAVERIAAAGGEIEDILADERRTESSSGLFAIFIGIYMIFNTMMIAVVQRRREIGLMRALGMRRREVAALVAMESLLLGALGCALGLPMGLWFARAVVAGFAAQTSADYAVALDVPRVVMHWGPALSGVMLGMAGALGASMVPARGAALASPIEAMRRSGSPSDGAESFRKIALAGIGAVFLGVACWFGRSRLALAEVSAATFSILAITLGISLVAPLGIRTLARSVDRLACGLGPAIGMATRGILANISRVAITCSVFVVCLTLVVYVAAIISQVRRTVAKNLEAALSDYDLIVTAGKPFPAEGTTLSGALAQEIAKLPGVAAAAPYRTVQVPYGGAHIKIRAFDVGSIPRALAAGDSMAADAVARGQGVLVSTRMAAKFGLRRADTLRLESPGGEVRLPILGFTPDDSRWIGNVVIDRALYRKLWRDDRLTSVSVRLNAGREWQTVAKMIRERWGDRYGLFVTPLENFRESIQQLISAGFAFYYVGLTLLIVIVLLGLLVSLLASVLDRIRQIGVLRAVGMTRAQVGRWIMLESGFIGLLSGLLAAVFGPLLNYYDTQVMAAAGGQVLLYHFPLGAVMFGVVSASALALAGGYFPGRSAAGLIVTEAVQIE